MSVSVLEFLLAIVAEGLAEFIFGVIENFLLNIRAASGAFSDGIAVRFLFDGRGIFGRRGISVGIRIEFGVVAHSDTQSCYVGIFGSGGDGFHDGFIADILTGTGRGEGDGLA